jgi:MYXO-CTERM domain-containing protein
MLTDLSRMSSYSTTAGRQLTTTGAKPGPSRLYVFAVLALAVFLLLVAIRRQPNQRFEATAALQRLTANQDAATVDANSLLEVLSSDQMLQAAIDSMPVKCGMRFPSSHSRWICPRNSESCARDMTPP